jgi:hypothetical protein
MTEEKKRPEKADLSRNPDKYKVRKFDPLKYELVKIQFSNGTTGYVERKKR